MSLKSTYRLLLNKKKVDDYLQTYPNIEPVLDQIKAKLLAYSAGWDKINFRLNETQQKSKRRLQTIWLAKAKVSGLQDVTNFLYRL